VIKPNFLFTALFLVLSVMSCTSSRWVIEDRNAIDRSRSVQIENKLIFQQDTLENNPELLQFNLVQVAQDRFDRRIKVRRYIQKYRPDFFWWPIGLSASAGLFYAANFDVLPNPSSQKELTLNVMGAGALVTTIYMQKAKGGASSTDETRMLAKTGTAVQTDTTQYYADGPVYANITIRYRNQIWLENFPLSFDGSILQVPINELISVPFLEEKNPGNISIQINSDIIDEQAEYSIPVSDFMRPFVQINRGTEIRQTPIITSSNIYTDLIPGSVLPLQEIQESWFKVNYGAAEAFVVREDAQQIWAPFNTQMNAFVESETSAPIANVDIDYGIPVIKNSASSRVALFLVDADNEAGYVKQDEHILRKYLTEAFGYQPGNIHKIDLEDTIRVKSIASLMRSNIERFRKVTVVLHSQQPLKDDPVRVGGVELSSLINIINHEFNPSEIDLFLDVPFDQSIDQQFLYAHLNGLLSNSGMDYHIMLTSQPPGQQNRLYSGGQMNINNKYSLFTYYYCLALKNGIRTWGDLTDYMRREVNYSSRRLYDQPQQPMYVGDSNDLID
jgi:hypothetical protein